MVDKDYIFYAVFMTQSVYNYDSNTEDKYFNFISLGSDGYSIGLNHNYRLKGKVTLPTNHQGKPVIKISSSGFKQHLHDITHIFWSEENAYNLLEIGDEAFSAESTNPTLIYVQCPDSVTRISTKAFYQQSSLVMPSLPLNLETIGALYVNRGQEGYTRVTLDTENYRAKREEALRRLANRMANRAVKTGRKVVMEPMNPYERRILHSALQQNDAVTTHSEGEEPNRHVVITLKNQ